MEDDVRLARLMQGVLQDEGYRVELASTGTEGLELALSQVSDVIILDLMLPGIGGLEVCRQIRAAHADTPILILTARDSLDDRVRGLDAGADDYLAKPFAFSELLARLRALGRRRTGGVGEVLALGDLRLDTQRHLVQRGSSMVELSPREFALLEYLLRHRGQVLARNQILERVWGDASDSLSNVVDTYIHYLRNKIDRSSRTKLIRTVRGVGYMIDDQ